MDADLTLYWPTVRPLLGGGVVSRYLDDIEISEEDGGETVVMRMSVHDAEDIAHALEVKAKHAYDFEAWRRLSRRLLDFSEARDDEPRPGIQIVMVPR